MRAYLDQARRLANFSLVSGALVRRIVIRDGGAVSVEYDTAVEAMPRRRAVKSC